MTPITDPLFYVAAVPAVLIVGLSKGGLGGGISLIGVPLMSLVIPPVQAAGIMLPILVAMDMVGLFAYRGVYDRRSLVIMLPAAMVGIAVGFAAAAWVTDAHVRLIVGLTALAFVANHYLGGTDRIEPHPHQPMKGWFWGTVSGFTSFVSHTGGPPYHMYMLPLRLTPVLLAGTSVIFFTTVNAVKLVPYFLLGQFDGTNLATSATLLPLAPLATLAGVYIVHRINAGVFYRITYATVALVSIKLIWDGLTGLGL